MDAPTTEDVRAALAALDPRQEKIVAGVFTAMVQNSERVRDREWIAEQLASVTLLAGEIDVGSTDEGVSAVQEFLQANASDLLNASFLLFHQVAQDMAPRVSEGFTFEDTMHAAVQYLPSIESKPEAGAAGDAEGSRDARDLGPQPIATLMAERKLQPKDLVAASEEQITHKMVARAMKGRRLTKNTMDKVMRAWNLAAGAQNVRTDLFNYRP